MTQSMVTARMRRHLIEPIALMLVTLALAVTLRLPTLWFVIPFLWISFRGWPYEKFGITIRNLGKPLFHLSVSLVVFGSYALLHYAFAHLFLGRTFHPTLAPDFLDLVIAQIVIIGLSEEFFFRGYLQTELNDYFGKPFRFLGASFGWGLIAAALLFGLCHLVHGDLSRIRVAFFGLFAGWLRERTDSIAVPATYHGVANLLYDFMQRSMH
jgi:membrane protease YdiL (CAAX protease family)